MTRIAPKGTILVGSTSSRCNACGQHVLPDSIRHFDVSGYAPRKGGGCLVRFTHIKPTHVGDLAERATRSMRPDLTFIPAHSAVEADQKESPDA